jgi:hypothetical protein
MISKKLIAAAGNAGGGDNLYVEDVFSTYLYTGTGSAQTITNGIDLDGEGGLVWIKKRGAGALKHLLYDTNRGIYKDLNTNDTSAEDSAVGNLTAFNSDGFSIGNGVEVSSSSDPRVAWTFRKAEKFFDVVTYTGNGLAGRTVAHNLGSVPACMIVKRINAAQGWAVYHVEMDATNPQNWMMRLNSTDARTDLTPSRWNDTAPTSTEFTLSDNDEVNGSGDTYVAYLFASDAGGFGDDGSESIIKCGTFTTNGTQTAEVTGLGWEPQYVLFKNVEIGNYWQIHDSMRGMPWGSYTYLAANRTDAEVSGAAPVISPTPDGFLVNNANYDAKSIYIAIRRPMKTPESGTEVFAIDTSNSTGNAPPQFSSSFPVDMAIKVDFSESAAYRYRETRSRLVPSRLKLNTADDEAGSNPSFFAYMDGCYDNTTANTSHYAWMFKRGTGFFDVVAYIGDGVAGHTINHNLGVVPELMIVKRRELDGDWICQVPYTASPQDYMIKLNTNEEAINFDDAWSDTAPTTTNFTLGNWGYVNTNGGAYIAYLFATLAGVSKVGSYTGTAATLNVDCGFSAGARFILIKRADSTGDWYVWDSARGIVAGDDPYFVLNTDADQVTNTDYIDPLSSGFTVTSSAPAALNASGGTYIFLAIA